MKNYNGDRNCRKYKNKAECACQRPTDEGKNFPHKFENYELGGDLQTEHESTEGFPNIR
jgi:hypothetical protein